MPFAFAKRKPLKAPKRAQSVTFAQTGIFAINLKPITQCLKIILNSIIYLIFFYCAEIQLWLLMFLYSISPKKSRANCSMDGQSRWENWWCIKTITNFIERNFSSLYLWEGDMYLPMLNAMLENQQKMSHFCLDKIQNIFVAIFANIWIFAPHLVKVPVDSDVEF